MNIQQFKHLKYSVPSALGMLGVLFFFVGSAVKQSEFNQSVASTAINFNPIASAWFETFYFLFLLVSIVTAILSSSIHNYKLALLAFLAVGFSSLISSLNDNIYITSSAGSALLSAGAIFLSFSFGLFILILGSDENSSIHNAFNQLGSVLNLNGPMSSRPPYHEDKGNRFQPIFQPQPQQQAFQLQQQAFQAQPRASVVPPMPIVVSRSNAQNSNNNNNSPSSAIPLINSSGVVSSIAVTSTAIKTPTLVETPVNTDVVSKVKALYEYKANKEDPHEISFAKGEILEILDNKGKWWKARRSDGTVGIAPSNYLQVI